MATSAMPASTALAMPKGLPPPTPVEDDSESSSRPSSSRRDSSTSNTGSTSTCFSSTVPLLTPDLDTVNVPAMSFTFVIEDQGRTSATEQGIGFPTRTDTNGLPAVDDNISTWRPSLGARSKSEVVMKPSRPFSSTTNRPLAPEPVFDRHFRPTLIAGSLSELNSFKSDKPMPSATYASPLSHTAITPPARFDNFVPPLMSTPTTELGAFEYPFPGEGSASSSPVSTVGTLSTTRTPMTATSRGHSRTASLGSLNGIVINSMNNSKAVTPPAALSALNATLFPRTPVLGRRGTIAYGQIPKLAQDLPGKPLSPDTLAKSSSANSNRVTLPVQLSAMQTNSHIQESSARFPPPRTARRSSSTTSLPTFTPPGASNPAQTVTTPTTLTLPPARNVPRGPTSPRVTSSPHSASPTIPRPPSRPTVAGGKLASRIKGPISFQQKDIPVPIPPSLLARRGSVPHNSLLGLPPPEGWVASANSVVYQVSPLSTPTLRERDRSNPNLPLRPSRRRSSARSEPTDRPRVSPPIHNYLSGSAVSTSTRGSPVTTPALSPLSALPMTAQTAMVPYAPVLSPVASTADTSPADSPARRASCVLPAMSGRVSGSTAEQLSAAVQAAAAGHTAMAKFFPAQSNKEDATESANVSTEGTGFPPSEIQGNFKFGTVSTSPAHN